MTADAIQFEDYLAHYVMLDGRARCAVAVVTNTTEVLKRSHLLDPMTTIALGRALACAALLGSRMKMPNQFLQLTFSGSGPMNRVVAECTGRGGLRGYVGVPQLAAVIKEGDAIPSSVGEALGPTGTIRVVEGRPDDQPHTAIAALENGEIAADVARYLTDSEQVPSAVAAGVKLDKQGNVLAAGGVLVQKLGGSELSETELQSLEQKMTEIHISDRIAAGLSLDSICEYLAPGQPFSSLARRPLTMSCTCTRERTRILLKRLGQEEVDDIRAEIGKVEVRCQYCGTTYNFKEGEVAEPEETDESESE
jgi:molecular chaperone Hsp33